MAFNPRRLIIPALLVLVLSPMEAKNLWVRYGWQAFVNSAEARSLALGGTPVAASGRGSQLTNPATLVAGDNRLSYSHQSRFAGMISSDLLQGVIDTLVGVPLGVALIREAVGQIPHTANLLLDWGNDGQPGTGDSGEGNGLLDEGERLDLERLSHFSQRQLGLHLSTVRPVGAGTIGLAVKILHHTLDGHGGSGIGFDLGYQRPLWPGWDFGLVVHDALTSWLVWDSGAVERTAPGLSTGISNSWSFQRIPLTVFIGTNLSVYRAGAPDYGRKIGSEIAVISTGIELIYEDKFSLRFGLDETGNIRSGLGVDWPGYGFDYAFRFEPSGSGFGPSHFLTCSLDPTVLRKIGLVF